MSNDDMYGNQEERQAALRVAEACQVLNKAIWDANFIGVNVKVVDLAESWDDPSNLRVERIERRAIILPAVRGES
jgi:hypothetical protein